MEGFIASTKATIILYPLEVFKTNKQVGQFKKISLNSLNNFNNLYRGLSPQILAQGVFYGSFFSFYNAKTQNISEKIKQTFIAGSIGSLLANPFYVIKTRSQTNQKSVIKNFRLRDCFRGLGFTYLNNTKLLIQFPLTDYLHEEKKINISFAAFLGKTIANFVLYPTDTIRTNLRNSSNLGLMNVIKNIHPHYFRGFLIFNLYSTPHFVLVMFFRENMK